jgi:hypothetical protein
MLFDASRSMWVGADTLFDGLGVDGFNLAEVERLKRDD